MTVPSHGRQPDGTGLPAPCDTTTATAQEKPGALIYTTVLCHVTPQSPDPMRKPAAVVEDLDVLEDGRSDLGQVGPGAGVDELALEGPGEALGDGVVPAFALA